MLGISGGQGLVQFAELGLAFALSAAIGIERELRNKSAGLRTHVIVGAGAALVMLVSKYGFMDVMVPGDVVLDPSRVAAQIVSGIGFLGAGLIFVRRDVVNGLTTGATIWLVAGIGMACGGGLAGLAAAVTGLYYVTLYALAWAVRQLPRIGSTGSMVRLTYQDGQGVLRRVLERCTAQGFSVAQVDVDNDDAGLRPAVVRVGLEVFGRGAVSQLAASLEEVDGVVTVASNDSNVSDN